MSSVRTILALIGLCVLVGILGFQIGRILERQVKFDTPPLSVVDDTRPKAPTIVLHGVFNGQLQGVMHGMPRFFIDKDLILPEEDGTFSVSVGSFFINQVSVEVPEGMYFVASKKGSKYYSITSAPGQRIVPENRVYFSDSQSAEDAGYTAGR